MTIENPLCHSVGTMTLATAPKAGKLPQRAMYSRLFVAAILATTALAFLFDALGWISAQGWLAEAPQLCWFQGCTGVECPGCGMGESLLRWVSRDPWGAQRAHPFSGPLLLIGSLWVVSGMRRTSSCHDLRVRPGRWGSLFSLLVLSSLLLWWLLARVLPTLA